MKKKLCFVLFKVSLGVYQPGWKFVLATVATKKWKLFYVFLRFFSLLFWFEQRIRIFLSVRVQDVDWSVRAKDTTDTFFFFAAAAAACGAISISPHLTDLIRTKKLLLLFQRDFCLTVFWRMKARLMFNGRTDKSRMAKMLISSLALYLSLSLSSSGSMMVKRRRKKGDNAK